MNMYTRSRQSGVGGQQQQQRVPQQQQQQAQGNQYQQQGQNNQQAFKQQQQQSPALQQQRTGQQMQQQQQQPKQQAAPGTPQAQRQPQQQQQQQQQLKPILKTVPNAPNQQMQQQQQQKLAQAQLAQQQLIQQQATQQFVKNGMEPAEASADNSDANSDVPKWKRKGIKVNKRLKRLRMNMRLRKTLQPKSAIMVLNEMKTGVQFTFPEPSNIPGTPFVVHATIDGKVYVGEGVSRALARQNAAENAFKSLLVEKMTAAAMKAALEAGTEIVDKKPEAAELKLNPDGTPMETGEESDEVPWSSLASFALFKLFSEWQNQGTVIPVPKGAAGKMKKEPKAVQSKELPADAVSMHPVMLLNQMKPGTTYVEVARTGTPPNQMFTLGVDIDGQQFTGSAKNKKDAKKNCAKNALKSLYNVSYPEESMDVDNQ